MGRRWLQMQMQLMQLGLGSLGSLGLVILGLGCVDWSRGEQQASSYLAPRISPWS